MFDKSANIDFSVSSLSYDANGNILSMNQQGLKANSSAAVDQLTCHYLSNSNKLQQVTDAVNDNTSKLAILSMMRGRRPGRTIAMMTSKKTEVTSI